MLGRPDIGSGPSRWPGKRTICVHPFLSVCICVHASCCLSKRETDAEAPSIVIAGRNAPEQAARHSTGSSTAAATVVTPFAIPQRSWRGGYRTEARKGNRK
jgi:hypothetical protein